MGLIPNSVLERRWLDAIKRIEIGELTFVAPSGERHVVTGTKPGPKAQFRIKSWDVVARMVARGDIGLGEDYIAGAWESDNVEALFSLFLLNIEQLEGYAHGSHRIPMVKLVVTDKDGREVAVDARAEIGRASCRERV